MRKVKYIPSSDLIYYRLTPNKIYDIICISETIVDLIDDSGVRDSFFIYFNNYHVKSYREFYDVTVECRSETIEEILM